MKVLTAVMVAVCCSLAAKAQYNNIFKRKPWEDYKLRRLLQDSLNRVYPVPSFTGKASGKDKAGVVNIPIKGVFIGENGNGDQIYAMQPDNMPCLVPGKKFISNMPVAGLDKTEKSLLPLLQKDEEKPRR